MATGHLRARGSRPERWRGAPAPLALLALAAGLAACSRPPPRDPASDRARISQALLPIEAWRALNPGPPPPRLLRVACDGRTLRFAGVPHATDPADPGLSRLEAAFRAFSAETPPSNATVLVEGRLRTLQPDRAAAVLRSGGEGGLATFLAHEARIPDVRCPEPTAAAQHAALTRHFPPAEVCAAWFARSAVLWQRQPDPPPLARYLEELWAGTGVPCDLSPEAMMPSISAAVGRPVAVADRAALVALTDPAGPPAPIRRVLREDARLRDLHVAAEIARLWREGRSLFVVYGAAHLGAQAPALREVLCGACRGPCRFEDGPL